MSWMAVEIGRSGSASESGSVMLTAVHGHVDSPELALSGDSVVPQNASTWVARRWQW